MEAAAEAAFERLAVVLRGCGSACIGYSGGVDSVFLARAALEALGTERVLAVTGLSAAVPQVQREAARRCAAAMGLPHLEIQTDELEDPNYTANPRNRCYHCKTELWRKLTLVARDRGLDVVMDGTNADDAKDVRPGMRAARELGIRSPLLEAGLTKADIRTLSRGFDLPTWNQPSAPCLSSRLPYGLAVTAERLLQIERAEDALRGLGFREFRVRHHDDVARLEFARDELPRALRLSAELDAAVRMSGIGRVLLDVEGFRSGALNEPLPVVTLAVGRA